MRGGRTSLAGNWPRTARLIARSFAQHGWERGRRPSLCSFTPRVHPSRAFSARRTPSQSFDTDFCTCRHDAMESVVLETSLGDIQLELYWNHAPRVSRCPPLLGQPDTQADGGLTNRHVKTLQSLPDVATTTV